MTLCREKIYILYLVITVILMIGCQRTQVRQVSNPEEIRELCHRVLTAADESPDSAMAMIERLRVGDLSGISPRKGGTLPDYHCDFLRAKIYAQSSDSLWLDSAIIIGEQLMTMDVVKEDTAFRQNVLEMLVNAGQLHGVDEQNIHWCTQLIDLCRQLGDETVALRNEAELGRMLAGIGKTDEGLAKIDNAVQLLRAKHKFNEMDACIIALRRKESVLDKEERYADIPPVAQAMLDLLADYEQHPNEFHDGSYREVTEELRPGYIEFYRAKAYKYMAYAYASLREKVKALEYLRLFEQCAFAKTLEGRTEIAPTWGLLGEYDKMSAAYDEFEARLREQGDTVNVTYANILRDRAKAAQAQGRYAESLRLHEQYEALTETLNDRLLQGKAHEYAARYHAQEQQLQIEREQTKNTRVTFIAFAIGILLLAAIIIAVILYYRNREIQRKNRMLAQQISEAVKYKEMYRKEMAVHDTQSSASTPDLNTLTDEQLFNYLDEVIVRERLYLDPKFGRQTLIDRFQLSKDRLGAAFSRGSEQTKLTDYIQELRLEYAAHLLIQKSDLSIVQIANDSGFGSHQYFCNRFKLYYGMSPSDFREARQ